MLACARSDCNRIALCVFAVVFFVGKLANATPEQTNEVVVQYSVDLYDRYATKEQVDKLRQTLQAANSPDASANYSTLHRLAQEKYCKRYRSGKLIFTLTKGQSSSVQFITDNSTMHLVAELVSISADSCEISLSQGVAGSVASLRGTGSSFGRSRAVTVRLDGTPVSLGGGGSGELSSEGPGKSSHNASTIRVWRLGHADAPNTTELRSGFGGEVVKRNLELQRERMNPKAPRFLRLDPVYDRLVLVHPSEYLDNLDVDDITTRLDNRSRNALDEICKVIKTSDAQRAKVELTFRRRNSKWLKELDQFHRESLSNPLAAGGKDFRNRLVEINKMLVQEFSATDSFVWRVMKTQFTDEQEAELSRYFVRKFVGRLATAFDLSDGAQNQLTGFLDKRGMTEGGFVLDEQEYLDWLLDREDSEMVDLLGDERKAKRLRSVARVSSNVKILFWNAAY